MSKVSSKKIPDILKIIFVGAHPDDADIKFGGTAIRYINQGHKVWYVSMTNGDAGHHEICGKDLAERRRKEADKVKDFIGLEDYIIFDNHDAYLEATIDNRDKLIKLVREVQADIIITHRPNDYHPDHRNTSLIVQNATCLFSVPAVLPNIEALKYAPNVFYHVDNFSKPYKFEPAVFVGIDNVFDEKIQAIAFHESQVFEWLPYVEGYLNEVPNTHKERIDYLKKRRSNTGNVYRFRPLVKELAKEQNVENPHELEAFEICEYGGDTTFANIKQLFPFGIINTDVVT